MSFDTLDVSKQDSSPVLLYQFNRGSVTWRYVALPNQIVSGGYTWFPEAITNGGIASTGDVPKDQVTVTVPATNSMATPFITYAPEEVTTVTIFCTNYDDLANGITVWKGRVLSVSATDAAITMTCEPVGTSLRRMGLRQTYQRTCRHMLFGTGCNVNRESFATTVTVVAVSGLLVTVSSVAVDFKGGTIKASDNSLRMIVNQAGNVLTLMRPVPQLLQDMAAHPTGFAVTLYRGCDKSVDTCRDVYHNLGNFGGFPGITGINPMNGTSNVF